MRDELPRSSVNEISATGGGGMVGGAGYGAVLLKLLLRMAMAMSTLQSSSVSTLVSSSRIASSFRCDEVACVGTSLKGSLDGIAASVNSALGNVRRGSCRSPRRFAVRSSRQRDGDFVEFCGGDDAECESENTVDLSTSERQCLSVVDSERSRWRGRRECLLAMAIGGVFVSQGQAVAEETEAVNAPPLTEAVDAPPLTEAVDAPISTKAVDGPNLELYVDEKEGFKLLRPALWNKVEKAGATVLFEDPAKRGNTIGVVVNPVRIASLKDFGTPDVVAAKLIAAERKKPSTNDAQLVRVQERQALGDTPLYALEYTLDSSRGQKRILSAVTVASKKLYILNITYVDSAATPAPPEMADAFTQVLNSFDLGPTFRSEQDLMNGCQARADVWG